MQLQLIEAPIRSSDVSSLSIAGDSRHVSRNRRPKGQLMKWVGNKYRYANEIVSYFPNDYNTYFEPFVGTGAVLATLQPRAAIAGDTLEPLIELWKLIQKEPDLVSNYYAEKWQHFMKDPRATFDEVKSEFNFNPNGLNLLFISRTCYGGVIRFTKQGTISTPIGPHKPINPLKFTQRLIEWRERVKNCRFECADFRKIISKANKGDIVYCDPPYVDSQSILYGSQGFSLADLLHEIACAKERGAKVALSIDGVKKSGDKNIVLEISNGLFEREVFVDCGYSMLRRFQKNGEQMVGENVTERLLLTW